MLRRQLKKFYDTFVSLKGRPQDIAKAFALGIVIGLFPILGIHSFIVAGLALVFRMNLTAMFLASWLVCNPITGIPVFALEYQVGRILLRMPYASLPSSWTFGQMLELGWSVMGPLFVGWVVLSAVAVPLTIPIIGKSIVRVRVARRLRTENGRDIAAAP